MEYTIIEAQGKQFFLKPGSRFTLNGTVTDRDLDKLIKVLALKDNKIDFGTPALTTKLAFSVVESTKSPKIHVRTYRSKSRYRRHIGHRQSQTIVEFQGLAGGKSKPASKTTKTTSSKATPQKKAAAKAAAKAPAKAKTPPKAKSTAQASKPKTAQK